MMIKYITKQCASFIKAAVLYQEDLDGWFDYVVDTIYGYGMQLTVDDFKYLMQSEHLSIQQKLRLYMVCVEL